jgi:hypothetical protein
LVGEGIVETLKISLNERATDVGRVVQTVQRSRIKVADGDHNQARKCRERTLEFSHDFGGTGADSLCTNRIGDAVGKDKKNSELINVGTVTCSCCDALGCSEHGILCRCRATIVNVVSNGLDDIRAVAIGRCVADVVKQPDVAVLAGTTERKGSQTNGQRYHGDKV